MHTPNEDQKLTDKIEPLKEQAAGCGPGCGCHASGKPSNNRWIIGAIVLAAAGALVVRAVVVKNDGGSAQAKAPAFATLAGMPTPASDGATNSGPPAATADKALQSIGTLTELNTAATNTDAVFVFLPGKEGTPTNTPAAPMNGAARTIESKAAMKCGLFTLKAGSPDYDQLAGRITLPGVLAMVKGRGMSAVSGEITEAKLVQGFVAASSAGGCGPAAGAGCCPK